MQDRKTVLLRMCDPRLKSCVLEHNLPAVLCEDSGSVYDIQ